AAEALRGGDRPVKAGPVLADDREVHPSLEPLRRKPAGKRTHLVGYLGPGPSLPDPQGLLPDRRGGPPPPGVMPQQGRKGIEPLRHFTLLVASRSGRNRGPPVLPQAVARAADCN